MKFKKIGYVKREFRRTPGRPDAYERICNNNTHLKLQSKRSKTIIGAAKLLVWNDKLEN